MNRLVVVCFDIFDDRRRLRVSNLLEDHGQRVQHSVFECHLAASELRTLKIDLAELIDKYEDHVRYYSLCNKDQPAVIVDGGGSATTDPEFHFV